MHRRSTTTSRAADLLLRLAGVLAMSLGFVTAAGLPLWVRAPAAGADPISDKKAEAAQLAAEISALGHKINILADQYDQAQIHAQQVANQITAVKAQVATDQGRVKTIRGHLRSDALDAFTQDGSLSGSEAVLQGNGNQASVRSGFLDTVSINEQSTVDALHIAQRALAAKEQGLQQAEQASQAAVAQIQTARQAAEQASNQEQNLLNSVKGQLAQLVAQAQAQAQAQQAAQQKARLAAQQQKQQQAAASAQQQAAASASATSTSQAGATSNTVAAASASPGVSSAGSVPAQSGAAGVALSWAERALGVPYVYGGASMSGFDCSGLVMWAYAHAGVSLAHYVPSIYASVQHIPESDLQPGDLVFASDLSHVGIYVGGGEMIDAPYTGTVVRYDSISYMPLAGRVG